MTQVGRWRHFFDWAGEFCSDSPSFFAHCATFVVEKSPALSLCAVKLQKLIANESQLRFIAPGDD